MPAARHVVSSLAAGVLGAMLLATLPAHAQPSGQDVATAQALFDEGKRLMEAGKHEEGCPKLVESQRLDPAGGTLLAIALCHEGQGKTATAWAEFGVALSEARKDRRPDREAAAQQHIKALEAKLTRVRIVVSGKHEGLEVKRDGVRVGDAQLGTPLPIDPGEHSFEAKAPGKIAWSKIISIRGEGATVDVTIPPLEEDFATPAVTPPKPAEPKPAEPKPRDDDRSGDRSSRLTFAAIVGGVGLVATGVGVAFGASASSKWSDAEKACPNGRCISDADVKRGEDAGSSADLATVFFVLGGVGLAGGLVLWLTAPSADANTSTSGTSTVKTTLKQGLRVTPMVTRETGGLMLGGTL